MKEKIDSISNAIAIEVPLLRNISYYWKDQIKKKRDAEVTNTLNYISEKLEDLVCKNPELLDIDYLSSDEYISTVGKIVEDSVREIDENKKKYLRTFLVNYAYRKRPDQILKEIFYQLVKELGSIHITSLNLIYEKQKILSQPDLSILFEQPNRDEAITPRQLSTMIGVDISIMLTVVSHLSSKGLVRYSNPKDGIKNESILIIDVIAKQFICYLSGEWNSL